MVQLAVVRAVLVLRAVGLGTVAMEKEGQENLPWGLLVDVGAVGGAKGIGKGRLAVGGGEGEEEEVRKL